MENPAAKIRPRSVTPPERRKVKRQRPQVRVWWRMLGDREGRPATAELKDIGTGGLALVVDRPCKQGTVVVVEIQGAEEAEPLLLKAEWSKQEAGNKWLIGCSATCPLTDEDVQAFVRIARKIAEQPARSEARPKPADDPFVMGSARERRGAARRGGLTVPVLISRAEGGSRVEGFVADRSL